MKLGKKSLLVVLSLIVLSIGFASQAEASVVDTSITNEIQGGTGISVVPAPDGSGARKDYTSSADGLRAALYDLYVYGKNGDFAIYFGATLNVSSGGIFDDVIPAAPSNANMTFKALEGKVGTLVLVSAPNDTISDKTGGAEDAKTITFATNSYFGTNMIFRNITYAGTTIYMNGHDLSLNGNAHSTAAKNIYGGSASANVTGSPTITVNSTGLGNWTFSGGNNTGGTLTGDTSLKINNVSGTGTITIMGGGNTANVNGNVTTEVNSSKNTVYLGRYIGGVSNGTINGMVKNIIKGNGQWSSNTQEYIGGSVIGNIGFSKDEDAIVNDFDTSGFSSGSVYYAGANYTSGTITGNIKNTVKAGKADQGSINRFDGAIGQEASGSDVLTTSSDSQTKEARRSEAESKALFKVYGDITNNILEGCISNRGADNTAYTRGAGYKGYYEGNITTNVGVVNTDSGKFGGAGFVYSGRIGSTLLNTASASGVDYRSVNAASSANNYYSDYTFFDIVGGGGSNSLRNREIYIYGNTNVNLNNVLARWTYAGGFSGTTEGNSTMTMNGGVVDTLEGAGYSMYRTYGNSSAILNNGQVDDFFCGASWHDQRIVGDTYAEVNGGIVNATFGGNFGNASDCTVTGNSKILVRGGNFAGLPRRGWAKALSPGPTQNGSILGDTELTIDLRGPEGDTFVLPQGTNISAGKPDSSRASSTYIGTDETNTMTLNIYTKPGSDKLNGAVLLGDSEPAANTKSGKVNININAPDSNIGNIYATEYSNIASNKILKDVTINLQNAASINGLSGGRAADNFTNTIVANSTNQSIINVGEIVDTENPDIQDAPILVGSGSTSIGIINFTEMNVKNGVIIQANSGNIKNGNGATAANHYNTYNQFGDITLEDGSGFGVTTTTGMISAGKLIIEGEGSIESGQGTGIINISDIEFVDSDNSRLTWIKNNTATTPSVTANGTWFGTQTAYQVLTINPTVGNASKITPFNFKGYEKATGKTFIGDNDVTGSANGYGIMIPGSVIDYIVKDPVIDGKGDIEHDVTDVKLNNQPTPLKVWGTEVAGTKVQKGRLIIPSSSNILPKLTFTPETATTGSWLYNANVSSSRVGSTDVVIGEQTNSNPVDWTSTDGSYSYEVEVRYSNQVELDARSIILTETEAASVSKSDIEDYTEVDGRPFLDSNIDSVLAEIQAPLGADEYSRKTEVTYDAGTAATNATNTMTETVNVIVVKDGAKVSNDRHGAIYAEAATLRLAEVQALTGDQIEFEKQYTNVRTFKSDGTVTADGTTSTDVTADASTYFDRLAALTEADVQDDSQVTYKLQYGTEASEVVSITVNITVMPNTTTFIIKFVDEAGSELHTPITSTETIGSTVDLKTRADVLEAISAVEALRYVIDERPASESAVEIVNGGTEVTYRFKGTLSIFSAPKTIDFGIENVGNKDIRVDNPEFDEDLVIWDNRSVRTEWYLTAKLETELTRQVGTATVIPNAIRYRTIDDNPNSEVTLSTTGAEEIVKKTQSTDKYNVSNDWRSGNTGFKLEVPASAVKGLGEYQATILWTLSDTR